MNITESEIKILIKYAADRLGNKSQFDPSDIVQDVLTECLEKKQEYNLNTFKHKIVSACLNSRFNIRSLRNDRKFGRGETDRFCKCCKQVLPIGMFYLVTLQEYGVQYIHVYCKDCDKKKSWERRKKRLAADAAYKSQQALYQKHYHKKWRRVNKKNGVAPDPKKVLFIEQNKIFDSIGECARYIDTNPANIQAVLRGRNKSYKGNHFQFV